MAIGNFIHASSLLTMLDWVSMETDQIMALYLSKVGDDKTDKITCANNLLSGHNTWDLGFKYSKLQRQGHSSAVMSLGYTNFFILLALDCHFSYIRCHGLLLLIVLGCQLLELWLFSPVLTLRTRPISRDGSSHPTGKNAEPIMALYPDLDLGDKVSFNGGSNVMVTKELSQDGSPINSPKPKCVKEHAKETEDLEIMGLGGQ